VRVIKSKIGVMEDVDLTEVQRALAALLKEQRVTR
jgi:hypothetical protein